MIKQFRIALAAGIAIGGIGFGGAANATSCSFVISTYDSDILSCSGNAACEAAVLAQYSGSHPECFGGTAANTAAATKIVQGTSLETMAAISANISNRGATLSAPPGVVADSGERKGLAAGNPAGKLNIWASAAQTDAKFDRGTYFFNTANRTNRFDNRIENWVLGGDYQFSPDMVLGLAGSVDTSRGSVFSYDLATPDGAKASRSSGASVAPYVGWQINKNLALDATVGFGKGHSSINSDITVTTDSTRFFYGANLSYTNWYGNWQVTGKGGYLFGQEKSKDSKAAGVTKVNTAVTNEVGQIRVGGQAAYWMNGVMPYFGLAYSSDNRSSTANAAAQDASSMGNNAWVLSFGANFISLKNSMTGGLGYEQESGRNRSKNSKFMANISARF